jgi:hypothetical protein
MVCRPPEREPVRAWVDSYPGPIITRLLPTSALPLALKLGPNLAWGHGAMAHGPIESTGQPATFGGKV